MRAIPLHEELEEPASSGVEPIFSRNAATFPLDRRIGSVLGRYRIESVLGNASLGVIYRASHVHTRKSVAIKVLHPELAVSSDHALRFEREAFTTSRINHPNVVRASDFERLPDGSMYLVLEHVPSTNLRSELASGPLSVERALLLTSQLADALSAVHAAGIIHRSIKPENLLLSSKDAEEVLKLTDFGLAALDLGEDCEVITRVGAAVGTPDYMAPEQVLGQWFDHRADLYSVGIVLYEMLSGRVPFISPSVVRVLEMHLEEEPPPLPEHVPAPIRELVASLLVKQPELRIQDCSTLLAAIENAASQVAQDDLRDRWTLKSILRRLASG